MRGSLSKSSVNVYSWHGQTKDPLAQDWQKRERERDCRVSVDSVCRKCPLLLSTLNIYVLRTIPLQRWANSASVIQLYIVNLLPCLSVCTNTLYNKLHILFYTINTLSFQDAEVSLSKSPDHLTSAFVCIQVSVCLSCLHSLNIPVVSILGALKDAATETAETSLTPSLRTTHVLSHHAVSSFSTIVLPRSLNTSWRHFQFTLSRKFLFCFHQKVNSMMHNLARPFGYHFCVPHNKVGYAVIKNNLVAYHIKVQFISNMCLQRCC